MLNYEELGNSIIDYLYGLTFENTTKHIIGKKLCLKMTKELMDIIKEEEDDEDK